MTHEFSPLFLSSDGYISSSEDDDTVCFSLADVMAGEKVNCHSGCEIGGSSAYLAWSPVDQKFRLRVEYLDDGMVEARERLMTMEDVIKSV